ncbi:MAG: hypothetical protein QF554_10080, partial [Dehalococcoidia bacterium]|nr:hypothetical protein [Dehalococcoidia bacterium]
AGFKRSSGYERVSTRTRRRPGSAMSLGRRTWDPASALLEGLVARATVAYQLCSFNCHTRTGVA